MDALAAVYDPELDEPITTLRFVSSCEVNADGDVQVALRLPTPQCAPNFAFLMAADARNVVRRLPGVRDVSVTLEDHYTGDEINAALNRGAGFTGAFPGETDDDELEALRELFLRKALVARQGRVCAALIGQGATGARIEEMRVCDLPDGPEARRCLELRAQLGIPVGRDAPAFVAGDGTPVCAEQLQRWLRMARLIATSLEANGGICRSLLQFRYGLADDPEEVRR
jgi:metal-sulfur cluster biosynthetic enzyme